MISNNRIGILMATYNGELYIREQLESIIRQTYTNWHLLIRDDGSTDNTLLIIKEFKKKYPKKITLINEEVDFVLPKKIFSKGAKSNFERLMYIAQKYFDFDFIMFSDQDDFWLEKKIEKSLEKILNYNNNIPILVHSDLKVVDMNLNLISDSLWKYQKLNPKAKTFNRLLIQNNTTGCTFIINKKLLEFSLPIGEHAIMHDWWIALVASVFGEIHYIDEPLVLYRQHGKNDTGAKKIDLSAISKVNKDKILLSLKKVFKQAESFKKEFYSKIPDEKRQILDAFLSIPKSLCLKKLYFILKYNFIKQDVLRNFAYFLHICKYTD